MRGNPVFSAKAVRGRAADESTTVISELDAAISAAVEAVANAQKAEAEANQSEGIYPYLSGANSITMSINLIIAMLIIIFIFRHK